MADAPLSTLSRAREQKISELSQHFANDDLSLDELERRIEQVYKAASVSELDAITSDLRVSQLPATARPSSAPMIERAGRLRDVESPGAEFTPPRGDERVEADGPLARAAAPGRRLPDGRHEDRPDTAP